jgi:hypothetical protein
MTWDSLSSRRSHGRSLPKQMLTITCALMTQVLDQILAMNLIRAHQAYQAMTNPMSQHAGCLQKDG